MLPWSFVGRPFLSSSKVSTSDILHSWREVPFDDFQFSPMKTLRSYVYFLILLTFLWLEGLCRCLFWDLVLFGFLELPLKLMGVNFILCVAFALEVLKICVFPRIWQNWPGICIEAECSCSIGILSIELFSIFIQFNRMPLKSKYFCFLVYTYNNRIFCYLVFNDLVSYSHCQGCAAPPSMEPRLWEAPQGLLRALARDGEN